MKVLQIGAGSMGSRRLRDLRPRANLTLAVFDERADRRSQAEKRFDITGFSRLEDALAWQPNAIVISTPPGTKAGFIKLALDHGLHSFTEADIWSYGATEIERRSRKKKIVCASSMSLRMLPVVKALASEVEANLGRLLSYQAFMATYMPGWHAGEGDEYYARHRNTAPAREMIPFELSWLNPIFGAPARVAGHYGKFGDLPGKTEDTWTLEAQLANGAMGQLAITMSCPVSYRRGACFGTDGFITWDIYAGQLTVQTSRDAVPRSTNHGALETVLEPMYAREIGAFIDAAMGRTPWLQSYQDSCLSTATLAAAERSHRLGTWQDVDLACDPDPELARLG